MAIKRRNAQASVLLSSALLLALSQSPVRHIPSHYYVRSFNLLNRRGRCPGRLREPRQVAHYVRRQGDASRAQKIDKDRSSTSR